MIVGGFHFNSMYGEGVPARENKVGEDYGVPGTSANRTVRFEYGPLPALF